MTCLARNAGKGRPPLLITLWAEVCFLAMHFGSGYCAFNLCCGFVSQDLILPEVTQFLLCVCSALRAQKELGVCALTPVRAPRKFRIYFERCESGVGACMRGHL